MSDLTLPLVVIVVAFCALLLWWLAQVDADGERIDWRDE